VQQYVEKKIKGRFYYMYDFKMITRCSEIAEHDGVCYVTDFERSRIEEGDIPQGCGHCYPPVFEELTKEEKQVLQKCDTCPFINLEQLECEFIDEEECFLNRL